MSQVKKQYKDEVHKSTTVVIKEDGANDFEILNNQFNLDDYKVNEQIKITTDKPVAPASIVSKNVSSGAQQVWPPAPDLTNATASTTPIYERPKTKMKRWSVREKEETSSKENTLVKEKVEKEPVQEQVKTVSEKPANTERIRRVKKTSNRKYKTKKRGKKKKRLKKLKKRKRKGKRNKKLGCYKF